MNLLTVKEVSQRLRVAVSYVWRLSSNDPTFPKPIHLGDPQGPRRSRVTRWIEADVMTWLDNKLNSQKGTSDEDRRVGGEIHQDQGQAVQAES